MLKFFYLKEMLQCAQWWYLRDFSYFQQLQLKDITRYAFSSVLISRQHIPFPILMLLLATNSIIFISIFLLPRSMVTVVVPFKTSNAREHTRSKTEHERETRVRVLSEKSPSRQLRQHSPACIPLPCHIILISVPATLGST